eukprot:tig00020902_g15035.t1
MSSDELESRGRSASRALRMAAAVVGLQAALALAAPAAPAAALAGPQEGAAAFSSNPALVRDLESASLRSPTTAPAARPLSVPLGGGLSLPFRPRLLLPIELNKKTIEKLVPGLVDRNRVPPAGLGILAASDEFAVQLQVTKGSGVLVLGVRRGGPADEAGIVPSKPASRLPGEARYTRGDIIIALDGQRIAKYSDLLGALEKRKPGDTVALQVQRGGAVLEVKVTLEDTRQGSPEAEGMGAGAGGARGGDRLLSLF